MSILRSEHPNPQFKRKSWQCLNGKWDFGFESLADDFAFSVDESKALAVLAAEEFIGEITVPFCPESLLSGIGHTDFMGAVWYRRKVNVNKAEGKVFLHVGAADYLTTVLINGKCVGRHRGGYTSFAFDITEAATDGENEIFIYCEDNVKNHLVPCGKQSERKESYGCLYTRTTGIWQSVWLECTPNEYVERFQVFPNIETQSVAVQLFLRGEAALELEAGYEGEQTGRASMSRAAGTVTVNLPLSVLQLWEPGEGRLYDLKIKFGNDEIESYFGMREIHLSENGKFILNGKSVFQRTVLDQGFYPDGIYTAPTEQALINDIELSMSLGFNGARLHQKVFEPLFLYHADRLGYLVWGEYPNWGVNYDDPNVLPVYLSEWREAVERDFNHPSIIGWCPFNETHYFDDMTTANNLVHSIFKFTKAVDPTRPCIDTSGYFHVETDIYDIHDYCANPAELASHFENAENNEVYEWFNEEVVKQVYKGEPLFVSEYGGIKWNDHMDSDDSWGYGDNVKSPLEFAERYAGLTGAITDCKKMIGFCYTQLTDVEQEQNGLYYYDRRKKFSDDIYELIKQANERRKE